MNRFWQAVFAFLVTMTVQRNPVWWASHHRHHHMHSDTDKDAHSQLCHGFWISHMLWFLQQKHYQTKYEHVKDLMRFPELRLLEKFDIFPPIMWATLIFLVGVYIETCHPNLQASRWDILIWGFFVTNVVVMHMTFAINSIAHQFGTQAFDTQDQSRNNFWLAILTLGEGWHNNHHHYPHSCRQGFKWWQIDLSYYGILILKQLGIVSKIRTVPKSLRI